MLKEILLEPSDIPELGEALLLSYIERAGSETETLVFIHGNSARKEAFQKQFECSELKNYPLIALDLPGHGLSARPSKANENPAIYSYDYFVTVIIAFITKLKLRRVILVGHSLGGHLAISVAASIPLRALVLTQTPPLNSMNDATAAFASTNPVLPLLYNPLASPSDGQIVADFFAQTSELKTELNQSWMQTASEFRSNFLASMMKPDFTAGELTKLAQLNDPWLILECATDPAINHGYFLQNELLKRHMVPLHGSKHYPHFELASTFNRELLRFIRSLN